MGKKRSRRRARRELAREGAHAGSPVAPARRRAVGIVALLAVGAITTTVASRRKPAPRPVVPEHADELDQSVRRLVERLAARASAAPRDAATHGELGLAYEANALWLEAQRSLTNAVALAPENVGWRLHLAIVTQEAGAFPESVELLSALAVEYPAHAAVQCRLGSALLLRGDLAGATAAYRRAVDAAPDVAEIHAGLGAALLRGGDTAGAVGELERAIAIDPGYQVAHYQLGLALRKLGRAADGDRELAAGQGGRPKLPRDALTARVEGYQVSLAARASRGAALLAAGRSGEAIEVLEGCRRDAPTRQTILNNLGLAYMGVGRYDEAEEALESALRSDTRLASTYVNLASLATTRGSYEKALDFARQAIASEPTLASAHLAAAEAALRLARHDECRASLARGTALAPQDGRAYLLLGELERDVSHAQEAAAAYHQALRLLPPGGAAALARRRLAELGRS